MSAQYVPYLLAAALIGCGSQTDAPTDPSPPHAGRGLRVVHSPDPAAAEAGQRAFADHELVQGTFPQAALRHLYISWSRDLGSLATYFGDDDAYWIAFNLRYGTVPSPFEGAPYPAGFGLAADGQVGVDCLLCHAGRHRGQTIIGLGNNRLDLRGLVEDLQSLPSAIEELKAMDLPAPFEQLVAAIPAVEVPEPFASLAIPTGAAGVNDAFGLGLVTSAWSDTAPSDLNTFAGYQDVPPWWTMRHKERLYLDGCAPSMGVYTMMATLMAFGLTREELVAYIPTFEDIQDYMCTLTAPRWQDDDELPPIDERLAETGSEIFIKNCARCHGDYRGGAYPNLVVSPSEVATDRFRVDAFTTKEADWLNGLIPGSTADMQVTGGYMAPDLTGVWASAPYLHNGSVPTLRSLLQPEIRPTRWRRIDGYNVDDVGLAFDVVDAGTDRNTIEGRRVVDTTLEAMDNGGHDFSVVPSELEPLLMYLRTL